MTKGGYLWEQIKPECDFCKLPASYVAEQMVERREGKTVRWRLVCFNHMAGWNEGNDWESPVFEIGRRLRPWNGPGRMGKK